MSNGCSKSFYSEILLAGRPIACEMGVLKVLIVIILFAGMPIACEMGAPKAFIVRILLLMYLTSFLDIGFKYMSPILLMTFVPLLSGATSLRGGRPPV